jgi:hypothetical protein
MLNFFLFSILLFALFVIYRRVRFKWMSRHGSMFAIEDELHADAVGQFTNREDALAELNRLVLIPWDNKPNRAPCTNWRNCGREYELIEYDVTKNPWHELSRNPVLSISKAGPKWIKNKENGSKHDCSGK